MRYKQSSSNTTHHSFMTALIAFVLIVTFSGYTIFAGTVNLSSVDNSAASQTSSTATSDESNEIDESAKEQSENSDSLESDSEQSSELKNSSADAADNVQDNNEDSTNKTSVNEKNSSISESSKQIQNILVDEAEKATSSSPLATTEANSDSGKSNAVNSQENNNKVQNSENLKDDSAAASYVIDRSESSGSDPVSTAADKSKESIETNKESADNSSAVNSSENKTDNNSVSFSTKDIVADDSADSADSAKQIVQKQDSLKASAVKSVKQLAKKAPSLTYKDVLNAGAKGIEYIITSAGDALKAIDVKDNSQSQGANVQLYDANGTNAQRYRFIFHSDNGGYYTIQNVQSGKVLDVENGNKDSGANVWMFSANGTPAQRWAVQLLNNGLFSIKSLLNGKMLDVSRANYTNGANIQVYDANGTDAQVFRLLKAGANINLSDGAYTIGTKVGSNKKVDVSNAGTSDGTNVQLYSSNNTAAQTFLFQKISGDVYRIISTVSGKVLDVANGNKDSGANVWTYSNNNTDAQKWIVRNLGDGTVYIKSALSGKVLDVSNAGTSNGTNIQVYNSNGTDAQKFILNKVSYKPAADGAYIIKNAGNGNMVLDIYNNDRRQQINVQLYSNNGTTAQKFNLKQLSSGLYTITNVNSRHLLDVTSASQSNGANIQQFGENGTWAQQWLVKKNSDGTLTFISSASSKALDIANGTLKNGTNIQQYTYNGTNAQKFRLVSTSYDKSLDSKAKNNALYVAPVPKKSNVYSIPTPTKLISIAQSQIGTNTGSKYWEYYEGYSFVNGSATPWCGCFVAWCFNQAGLSDKISGIKNKAYVPNYYNYAVNTGKWRTTPTAGDIVVFGKNQHVGIVEKVVGDTVYTIEGNTGSTKNGQVLRHAFSRFSSWIKGFLHWQ